MSILEKRNLLISKINMINDDSLIEELLVSLKDVPANSDFKTKWENSISSDEFIENMRIRISRIASKYDKVS